MSRFEPAASFVDFETLRPAMTARELKIPTDDGDHDAVQPIDLEKNEVITILGEKKINAAPFQVRSIDFDEVLGRVFTIQHVNTDNQTRVTDWQLAMLERAGRLVVNGEVKPGKRPPSDMGLTPDQIATANRMLGYLEAVREASDNGNIKMTESRIRAALEDHARANNDKPISVTSYKKYSAIYESSPFNMLSSLVPNKSSGNRTKAYGGAFERLVKQCVIATWQQPKGSYRTLMRLVRKELKKPKYAELEKAFVRPDGELKPDRSWFSEKLANMDGFTKDALRLDSRVARRKHPMTTRRPLPDSILDEVEADYTTLNIFVIDDKRPLLYGRPKIIVFRDRKSAAILGFSIFFGNPSYEAFIHGLRHAIYPKNMSKYPGLSWPMYGKPSRLIIDNDPHLRAADVKHACDVLGIRLVQTRPGEPNTKGGVERMMLTLENLINNIKGSVHHNPKRRKDFEDKEAGKPVLTLSELEYFITVFICGDYHVTPRNGIGATRLMPGIPEVIWKEDIVNVKARRPINPETFVRLTGNRRDDLTIQDGKVRWDSITYYSEALLLPSVHRRHKAAVPGVNTTEFVGYRDPADLGRMWLVDHLNGTIIEVPVCDGDRAYANGLRLYQHNKAKKFFKRKMKRDAQNTAELMDALNEHLHLLDEMHAERKKAGTANALASYHQDLVGKRIHGEVVEMPYSEELSDADIDWDDPDEAEPLESASDSDAPSVPAKTPRTKVSRFDDGVTMSDPLAEKVRDKATKKAAKEAARKSKASPTKTVEAKGKRQKLKLELGDVKEMARRLEASRKEK